MKSLAAKAIAHQNYDRRVKCPQCWALFPQRVGKADLRCGSCNYSWSVINGDPR